MNTEECTLLKIVGSPSFRAKASASQPVPVLTFDDDVTDFPRVSPGRIETRTFSLLDWYCPPLIGLEGEDL